jgi:hypothetical protein
LFESPFSGIFEAVKRNKGMKTTEYFRYLRKRPDRANIKEEWILQAIRTPIRTKVQSDARIRKWTKVAEENKYLRVILLEDGANRLVTFKTNVLGFFRGAK